jgi:hypothetical protein
MATWLGPLPDGPLALDLVVRLPAGTPLASGGHDLDNYLFPIAHHLNGKRFDAAFASKTHTGSSTMAVEPARTLPDDTWRPKLQVQTVTSTDKIGWKQEIERACIEQVDKRLAEGPVRLEMHYRLHSRRNWVNLWKPTIDALGPVLGAPDPRHPYNVNDDRITHICLTRSIDDTLGWNVQLEADWTVLAPERTISGLHH